jgi:OOP family OmpA-OmpF porin
MSKKFLYIASILLTIIIGTVLFWYYTCDCGGKSKDTETAVIAEPVTPAPEAAPTVDWQAIKGQLNDNPPTPIFEPYQTERTLGQGDINKVGKILDYLKNNPDGSLLVIGHTDISGSRALNMKLSRERADFVKSYLVQNGIDEGKISSSFKGPDEPAHDNSTVEGRAKNRRAVVLIK